MTGHEAALTPNMFKHVRERGRHLGPSGWLQSPMRYGRAVAVRRQLSGTYAPRYYSGRCSSDLDQLRDFLRRCFHLPYKTIRLTEHPLSQIKPQINENSNTLWPACLHVHNLRDLYAESGQTLKGSFSAVSKLNFASKYTLESSRQRSTQCTPLHRSIIFC